MFPTSQLQEEHPEHICKLYKIKKCINKLQAWSPSYEVTFFCFFFHTAYSNDKFKMKAQSSTTTTSKKVEGNELFPYNLNNIKLHNKNWIMSTFWNGTFIELNTIVNRESERMGKI